MNKKTNIASLRQNYTRNELIEENVLKNPFLQFEKWFKEAIDSEILEPNAMCLSTVSNGKPSSRIVLLKGFDENGFVFFTNYKSHKGLDIEQNNHVAVNFFWAELERQVRIEGEIEKVSEEESEEYFHQRPISSQIGAWVSEQSNVIPNREVLEKRQVELEAQYKDSIIPKPPHWGGYRVKPNKIEFWQGRPSRLHDRILFTNVENNWKIERLSP
ncbi:MAG: pyridoxamine 5'-phosphate oxidase [Spirosomataceae bacterium]